ncbi:hypothetical protein K502DRAFT_323589 [Neoconidiobolus thromboides FSU 785]|nr:hypothetical protein K502DRAFT_323589 [Neoconidiobolus thromboides FSU 785]
MDAVLQEQKEKYIKQHCELRNLSYEEIFSEEPTKNLLILNLGFSGENAATMETVKEVISPVIGSERVVANMSWPYMYVVYSHVELAINAMEEFDGVAFKAIGDRVLFTKYVHEPQKAFD